MTCTSTDPLVATLFAVYARRFGRGVVILGERSAFGGLIGDQNYMDRLESAVNLLILPIDFERRSSRIIGVDRSVDILAALGFSPLPIAISHPTDLRIALERTLTESFRLNDRQIIAYNARAEEVTREP